MIQIFREDWQNKKKRLKLIDPTKFTRCFFPDRKPLLSFTDLIFLDFFSEQKKHIVSFGFLIYEASSV